MEVWHIWVIAGLVLWITEIFMPGAFITGIFGTACLIAAPFAGMGMSFKFQLFVFAAATGVIALAIRPFVMRHFYRPDIKSETNVDALIGKYGLVTEEIDDMAGTGRVKIGGEDWRAVTSDEMRLAIGQKVIIRGVEGCKVIVERVTEKEGRNT